MRHTGIGKSGIRAGPVERGTKAMRTLGQILLEAEERTGLGVGRAAAMCGANRSTYRNWKKGQRPELRHAAGIIRFTGEDPRVILDLVGLSEDDINALLTYAKGVWLTSAQSMVPAA
jgi:hypothetical protein